MIADAQAVKISAKVPESDQGIDAGENIKGRDHDFAADFLGLVLAVVVTAVSIPDTAELETRTPAVRSALQ